MDPRELIAGARAAGRLSLSEADGKRMLARFGVPVPRFAVARTADDAESCLDGMAAHEGEIVDDLSDVPIEEARRWRETGWVPTPSEPDLADVLAGELPLNHLGLLYDPEMVAATLLGLV